MFQLGVNPVGQSGANVADLATVATYLDRLSGSFWWPRNPMSDQPFKVGDAVRVKGADAYAPTMTLTAVTENRQGGFTVRVTWYVEGEWKEHDFPTEALGQVLS